MKKGKYLSVAYDTNLLSAATPPVMRWASLIVFGEAIFKIALTLDKLASIPI